MRGILDVTQGSVDAVIAAVKPGDPLDVAQTAAEEYVFSRFERDKVWWVGGYALGIALPPDWVGHTYLSNDAFEQFTWEPGYVTNYENILFDRDRHFTASYMETLLMTETGIEVLSGVARGHCTWRPAAPEAERSRIPAVAEYQITYWRDLPSLVTARDGDDVSKVELPAAVPGADRPGRDGRGPDRLRRLPRGLAPRRVDARRRVAAGAGGGRGRASRAGVPGMSSLYERLDRGDLVLGDGAMGTMLQERGLDDGGAPELWNVERAEPVAEILAGYADAGAQYLTTNTFGGTAPRLQLHGLAERVEELSRAGAEVARGVADRYGILVAGDVGPTGEILFPLGVLEQDEAQTLFEAQVRGLAAGGADFILIETMSALEEVEAAVRAAQVAAPELPVAVTMSFDTNLRTMMGVTPAQAVHDDLRLGRPRGGRELRPRPRRDRDDHGADGRGPARRRAPDGAVERGPAEARRRHVRLRRHAGGDGRATPGARASSGSRVIGGCCGSTPAHIAAMRDALAVSA